MFQSRAARPLINEEYWHGKCYLNTAAEGLPLKACAQAVNRYLDDKSRGEPGRVRFWNEYERARRGAARLFSVPVDQIALVSSTTEALNTIAHAIDWRAGDEVVFTSVEFPSNIFPWVTLQERGVRLRIVHPGTSGVSVDEILEQINSRTRLVTVSQVSYATGQHIDPHPIWERVRNSETLLCVDATQAAARVPVDGRLADFTIASAFKWMNSIHGAAILSVSERALNGQLKGPAGWLSTASCFAADRLEQFHPRTDAQRYQAGMPNFDSVYALAAALDVHTPESVEFYQSALAPLVNRLCDGLSEMGLKVLVPSMAESRAGIVPFAWSEATQLRQQLAASDVFVQGDDGRIRAAIHWYNTLEHVERYLSVLKELLAGSHHRQLENAACSA
ncbi:aminotransferase class V-fold PLP-dependent enzyme [Planctomicrobium piriforme]|uniref:Selenocysteine lyase/Cysteine desulfurase n=1 Tax=Planctomicrobium piriforme TaxID=1576369 RepID=A0A1I3IN44_9PLAN|nr:aminotransferase class V-fold PLP-dependent enzyme [Planctomicrobium piriforme]SFI49391.1 Selenocysteine lyase/Cysteine desulfurase [Planctomicrobium piriforme]